MNAKIPNYMTGATMLQCNIFAEEKGTKPKFSISEILDRKGVLRWQLEFYNKIIKGKKFSKKQIENTPEYN